MCDIIRYDPDTGLFYWTVPRPKIRVGEVAGSLHYKGYVIIELYGVPYFAHRLAWFYVTGKWPKNQIDHINRERADNRFANLREATHGQNRANSRTTNRHGFKGVTFHKWLKEKPYSAQITFKKKVIYLGCYATAKEAHDAYKKAAIKMHGEFTRT